VLDAGPDVLNHNIETVPRLYRMARSGGRYPRSLELLDRSRRYRPDIATKTGIMVGLGEERDEILTVFDDLRRMGVSILTIGQYLRPSPAHATMTRYYHPDEFADLKRVALEKGFVHVESGPLVRSSYHAHEQADASTLTAHRSARVPGFLAGPDVLWEIPRSRLHTTLKVHSKLFPSLGLRRTRTGGGLFANFWSGFTFMSFVSTAAHPCTLFIGSEPLLAAWNARAGAVDTVIPVAHTDLSRALEMIGTRRPDVGGDRAGRRGERDPDRHSWPDCTTNATSVESRFVCYPPNAPPT
jgi:hypothetical protein